MNGSPRLRLPPPMLTSVSMDCDKGENKTGSTRLTRTLATISVMNHRPLTRFVILLIPVQFRKQGSRLRLFHPLLLLWSKQGSHHLHLVVNFLLLGIDKLETIQLHQPIPSGLLVIVPKINHSTLAPLKANPTAP